MSQNWTNASLSPRSETPIDGATEPKTRHIHAEPVGYESVFSQLCGRLLVESTAWILTLGARLGDAADLRSASAGRHLSGTLMPRPRNAYGGCRRR